MVAQLPSCSGKPWRLVQDILDEPFTVRSEGHPGE